MTRLVRCDGCGSECHDDRYASVTVTRYANSYGAPQDGERHYCLARDGGSIGCAQLIVAKLNEIDRRTIEEQRR